MTTRKRVVQIEFIAAIEEENSAGRVRALAPGEKIVVTSSEFGVSLDEVLQKTLGVSGDWSEVTDADLRSGELRAVGDGASKAPRGRR